MTKKKESRLGGFGHFMFGRSRGSVEGDLSSPDEATRIVAASRVFQVNGPKLDLAVRCIGDPVPVIRQHGLRALLGDAEGRDYLATFLATADPAYTAARDRTLDDLLHVGEPGFPFEGKEPAKVLSYSYVVGNGEDGASNIFRDALVRAGAGPALLPLLAAAAKCGLLPAPVTRWARGFDPQRGQVRVEAVEARTWPNRCSSCGSPAPLSQLTVSYTGETGRSYSGNQVTIEKVEGRLAVPVCARAECQKPPQAHASPFGLGVSFRSPEFIAELIQGGEWFVLAAPTPFVLKDRKPAARPALG